MYIVYGKNLSTEFKKGNGNFLPKYYVLEIKIIIIVVFFIKFNLSPYQIQLFF